MKVLVVLSVCLAGVLARGSGPYLPSGWRPDGPAFFLPSEVSKPADVVKDEVLQESEASGSDFLREYGPPKVQEVSQELSQQGLPDVENEQYFVEVVVETSAAKETSDVVTAVSEEKTEEVSSEQEARAVTDSQIFAEVTAAVEAGTVSNEAESSTVANVESVLVGEDSAYIEPTEAAVEGTQEATSEANAEQSIGQVVEESAVDAQQESEQSVSQVSEESAVTDATEAATGSQEEITSVINEQTSVVTTGATESQLAEVKVEVSAVEEKIQTVQEEVKKVEEVVQNIPELIVTLENEIKTQQAETIQEIPVVVQEALGSLEQVPEGFLEYGPPGFREYGPPKEDLKDNTVEEKETQAVQSNEVRRRRFSPKFRPSKKLH